MAGLLGVEAFTYGEGGLILLSYIYFFKTNQLSSYNLSEHFYAIGENLFRGRGKNAKLTYIFSLKKINYHSIIF